MELKKLGKTVITLILIIMILVSVFFVLNQLRNLYSPIKSTDSADDLPRDSFVDHSFTEPFAN